MYKEFVVATKQNKDLIEGEISANSSDAKWKSLYEAEYERQNVIVRGLFAMGTIKGKFSEDYVKYATLQQMKQDGVL